MRFAYSQAGQSNGLLTTCNKTYIFDVWARMNGYDVAVFHSEVVSNDSVDASTAIIEIIVVEDDKDGVLPLLAFHQNRVTSKELQGLHGVIRKRNDGVVVANGVCDAAGTLSELWLHGADKIAYINEFGFFFFRRMAVDVPSSFIEVSSLLTGQDRVRTYFFMC